MRNDIYKLIAALLLLCTPCFAQSKSSGASGAGTTLASGMPSTTFTPPVALDKYGGRTDKSCTNTTGHFIVEKIGNRWFFCDALGNVFIAMGSSNTTPNSNPTNDCTGKGTFTIYNTKYGGTGNPAWFVPQEQRMALWGLNVEGEDYTFTPTTDMPYIAELKPAEDAASNSKGFLTSPLEDLITATDLHYTSFHGGAMFDLFNPALNTEWTDQLAGNGVLVTALKNNDPHVLFLLTEDSDAFFGFGPGPDFYSNLGGGLKTNPDPSFIVMISSPVQTYNALTFSGNPFLYSDQKNYSKSQATNPAHGTCSISAPCSLRDFLYDEYSGSISALNTAWGSNYTTFDSTGTQITAESLGTGTGSQLQFTGTLAHASESPLSFYISVGGTAKAGDCPWFKSAGNSKCFVTTSGYGVLQSPTAGYLVPAVTIGSGKISESGSTVTALVNNTFTTGQSVHVNQCGSGQTGYDGTWTITSATATQFQYTDSNTGLSTAGNCWASENFVNYSTGAFAISFVTAPANAAAITLNYIYGGWNAGGTGLMDENGAGSWIGTNNFCVTGADANYPEFFTCTGGAGLNPVPNAAAQVGIDLDTWAQQFSAEFFKVMRSGLTGVGSHVPYFGLDAMGGYGVSSAGPLMRGMAPYVDGGWIPLLQWVSITPAFSKQYSFVTRYLGDKPFMVWGIPQSGSDSSYYCDGSAQAPTQALRGYNWYQNMNYLFNTLSFNNDYQAVGAIQWSWQDFQGLNQGLMSLRDNPYNGLGCYLQIDQLGNPNVPDEKCFGDFLSWMVKTNYLWFSF